MLLIRITKKFNRILTSHQKLRIVELCALMVIGGLLEMCSVSLILPFMNAVMEPEATMEKWYVKWVCGIFGLQIPKTFLVFTAIVLACVYILKNIYLLFEFNIQYRFVYGNMLAMQNRLLESYIQRPYEYFLSVSSGEIVRMINTDTVKAFELLQTLLTLFTELIVSGMLVVVVFVIAPIPTLCMAVVLALLLFCINSVIRPVLRDAGLKLQESGTGLNKWLLQSIQGIKELKIMGKENFFRENFDRNGRVYVDSTRKSYTMGLIPRFMIEALSMGTMFLVIALLIYKGSGLETIVPMLSAVAMAAIRLLPSVQRISGGLASAAYHEPMLDKMMENLRTIKDGEKLAPDGITEKSAAGQKQMAVCPIAEKIDFKEITFRYPDAEVDVLRSASMTVRRGESIGIVGSSGAGKTTAIDILLGLLRPQQGRVLVDGVDISQDIRGWHRQIGYIPQMIFMLDGSIRANVAFGEKSENISEDAVWYALAEASLADFVRGLPDGVDTEIGERGVRLSGGQRQRIGIARALYRDPDVLVFDEATSALDHETELEIMESIRRFQGHKTLIIIAHRLTTIESCDHIYRVENGKIFKER